MAIGKALPTFGAQAGRAPKSADTGRLGGLLLSAGAGTAAATALIGALCARAAAAPLAADLGFPDGQGEQIALEELAANAHGVASSESPWYLLATGPHTGTPLDLLVTGGTAAAVIGLCLLAAGRLTSRGHRLLAPALGAGAAPLTVYTAHVLGVVAANLSGGIPVFSIDGGLPWWFSSPQLWALHAAGALAIGLLLRLTGRRGPLEALVSACGRRPLQPSC